MADAGGGFAAFLLVLAFRKARPSAWTGLALGLYRLALNLGFDIAILVPFTKTPIVTYLYDIGLRYLDRHAGQAKREPGSQRGERIALLRSRIGN
jgi:hypothetical protein